MKKPTPKKKEEKKVEEMQVIPETPAVVEQPMVPSDYKTKLSKDKIEVIKTQIARGATEDELRMFLYVCERTKLDPFTKQVHFVKRWDSKLGKEVGAIQVGIDGLRSIAERTGDYAGNDDPIFDGKQEKTGFPESAKVTVYKMVQGQRFAFTATARWAEFFPGDKIGFMWKSKPHVMLGKCAEAQALRKAFPSVMSGLYINEEMDQAKTLVPVVDESATMMETAISKIQKQTNKEILEDFRKKVSMSKKYSDIQKKAMIDVIDMQITKLSNDTKAVPVA